LVPEVSEPMPTAIEPHPSNPTAFAPKGR